MTSLAKIRKAAKLTQVQLADAIGTGQPTIHKLETGGMKLTKEWAERLAPVLGVIPAELVFDNPPLLSPKIGLPLLGTAKAGAFMDITLEEGLPPEIIAAPIDPRYSHASQYALRVSGDSMDRRFNDNSIVTCAKWDEIGVELRPGMCVHVEKRQGELVENTLKIFTVRHGRRWLEPDSTNPKYKPIEINGDEGTEIVICGLVLGVWTPLY